MLFRNISVPWRTILVGLGLALVIQFAVHLPLRIDDGDSALSQEGVPTPSVYTTTKLKQEMASAQGRLLLIVLGRVYDVTAGKQYYAEGEGYHGYCLGLDHTKAFLSANFDQDSTDDLSRLSPAECLSVKHWSDFYVDKDLKKEYPFMGFHEGRELTPFNPLDLSNPFIATC